jgi:UDP-glucose 4-epimerase
MALQKILITGSAGLIGSALTQQLLKKGLHVVECDIRLPMTAPGHGDVRDLNTLTKLIRDCQGIIHLAAVSRVVWGEQNPQLCWEVNVGGTHNIIKAAQQAPQQPWIIFASSREVYGQQTTLPVTEQADLIPLNTYARSKVAGEELMIEYQQQSAPAAILRFSSVYGSAQDYNDRVIPAFCQTAVKGSALRVDGFKNLFDFTHVNDTARGVIQAMEILQTGVRDLPPIHLTTGCGNSLLQVITLIEAALGKPIHYQEAPARTYDVHRFCGDPTRAKKLLNWEAQNSLAHGIRDLLNQYQS